VPFTLVHAEKYRTEDKLKIQKTDKLSTTQKKQTTQNKSTLVQSLLTSYDTRPENKLGLLCNAADPTRRAEREKNRQIERERVCGNAMKADITRDCYSEGTERCCYSPDDEGMSREIHSERAHRPAQDRQGLLFDRFPSTAGWTDDDISCPHHQPVTSPAASTTQ